MHIKFHSTAEPGRRAPATRNPNVVFSDSLSVGDRLADRVAAIGGSWRFIIGFGAFLGVWALVNSVLLAARAFDPFPYIFLNLMLSMLAALQAPIIMMSQNRQAAKDRLDAKLDYETNVRAEAQIMLLHQELLALREDVVRMSTAATATRD